MTASQAERTTQAQSISTYYEPTVRNLKQIVEWHLKNITQVLENPDHGSSAQSIRTVIAEATQALSAAARAEAMEEILRNI